MADIDDYGMQMEEVVQTFHLQGKCSGCGDSKDGYCSKHGQWGYSVSKCNAEVKVKGEVRVRTYETREVLCLNTGERFESLTKAAEHFKTTPGQIHQVCIGRHKHTRGNAFVFSDSIENKQTKLHAITVICKSTGETYKSIKSAAVALQIPEQTLRNRLKANHPVNGKMYETLLGVTNAV